MNWIKLIQQDFDTYYPRYLKSKEWREKRKNALEQTPVCNRCNVGRKTTQVYHATYKNLGNEPDGDLRVSCGYCYGSGMRPSLIETKLRFDNHKLIDQLITLLGEPTVIDYNDDNEFYDEEIRNSLDICWQSLFGFNQISVIIDHNNNVRIWYQKVVEETYTDLRPTATINCVKKLIGI